MDKFPQKNSDSLKDEKDGQNKGETPKSSLILGEDAYVKKNSDRFKEQKVEEKTEVKEVTEEVKETTDDIKKEEVEESKPILIEDNKEKITDKTPEQIKEEAKRSALEKIKQGVSVVNAEELAINEARRAADANMTESAKNLKGIKGFFVKIWKHTYFDEYYRQKQVNKVTADIKNSDNIYVGRIKDADKTAHESAMKAISDRFTSEYEGTLSKGEEKKILDDKEPETIKAKTDIKTILDDYAMGKIDDEVFKSEKSRIINGLKKEDLLKGANTYADNLFEIAQNARLAIEHGAKMNELDYNLNIVIGKAKSSLKTEAHFNLVDKGIDKMKKSKVGRFVSPAVLSTGVGVAYSLSVFFGRRVMGSKAAAYASLGGSVAVSAAFAGMNESQRVALERAQRNVEVAEGSVGEAGDKRREQLDQFGYKMESSTVLAENLRSLMFEKDKDGKEVLKDIKKDDLDSIIASLSEIDARKSLNVRNKIDLISYSSAGNVEKESTDLTILTARAKAELTKKIETDLKDGLPKGETLDSYLAKQTQVVENTLLGGEKGINSLDKSFSKYKSGRIAKKMTGAVISGFIVGGAIQEGVALAKDGVHSVFEGSLSGHATMQTPFAHAWGWATGHPTHMEMGNSVTANFNGHNFCIPEGTTMVNNPDGTINLMRGDSVISSHFLPKFDSAGNLDASSIAKLGEDGVMTSTTHQIIDSTKEVTTNSKDWIHTHPGETIKVSHDSFMDQNTPMVQDPANPGHLIGADGNEVQTHWGGPNGTGINENGDAVLNVSHMTSSNSFHEGISVNVPEEVKNGNVMAIIYLNGGSEGIPVPVGANGDIIFDHNNPIMQQIFKPDANGHIVSHAKVIEIVQKMGLDKNGVEHVRALSALRGEGLDSIKHFIPTHEDIPYTNLAPSIKTEMPYFVPILSRRPLGPVELGKDKGGIDKKDSGKDMGAIGSDIDKPKDDGILAPEKKEGGLEMSQEEYDAMKDDLNMLNKKIQASEGIITLTKMDFKSLYGQKRYTDLKSIGEGIPVRFNKYELQTIGDEMEGLLSKAKVVSKEALAKLAEEENKAKNLQSNLRSDLELLNQSIRDSKGIITLKESDFKTDLAKEKYRNLKSIPEGKNLTFNKTELEKIATDVENYLSNYGKIMESKVTTSESNVPETKEDLSKINEGVVENNNESDKKSEIEEVVDNTATAQKSIEVKKENFQDLLQIGKKFSYGSSEYEVAKLSGSWTDVFNRDISVITKDSKTGKKKTVRWNKKELNKLYEDGKINTIK